MKPQNQNAGYKFLRLVGDTGTVHSLLVHRIVATVFLPNPKGLTQVNHIDGDKHNNQLSNLEWVSAKDNLQHARDTGLKVYNNPTLNKKLGGKKKSYSAYFGVGWDNTRNKWRAGLIHEKKNLFQKRFDTELEAAMHYNNCVIALGLEHLKPLNDVKCPTTIPLGSTPK